MKFLKIVFSIIVLLFFVVVFILAGLYLFFDPDRLKPVIIDSVKKQGYILTIDDKIGWSIYPKIGITIKHMSISVPNTEPFLDLTDVHMATHFSQLIHGVEAFQGNIHIRAVRLMKLHAKNAYVKLGWENNILTLHPITASLYDGSLSGIIHAQQLSTNPKWDWALRLESIQVKKLLEDIKGKNRVTIAGIGEFRLTGMSQGRGGNQLLSNAIGTHQFNIHDGVLEGIDLNYLVITADALINKQTVTLPTGDQQTPFDNLSGTAAYKDGIANAYALFVTKTFTGQTNGTVNLVNKTLDLTMKISTQQTIQTQWEIPVLITGDIDHPNVRLDMDEIQKHVTKAQFERVKEQVKDKINKVKEEITTHLPAKAGNFLQNLIGK